eukprot:XP_019919579.1 PREDICTED: uncharacterized protein LOC105320305 isoform X2 [Crassostrea gigas]
MNNNEQDNNSRYLYRDLNNRTCHTLLALKGILLVAAIVLISSSNEISKAKECDLEEKLVSLSVDITSPCKYDEIKKKSTTLCDLGISFLVLNAIIFLLIFNSLWIPKDKEFGIFIALIGFVVVAAVYSGKTIKFYKEVLDSKTEQKDAYDCCAINQVQGTTNDFDSTPWCTTSGSCQATASQIPKTCCNYVTEEDYGSAPTACHSSVNPGTFKSNCMIPIKTLSTIHIEECQLSQLLMALLTIGTFGIAEILIEGIWISIYFCCLIRNTLWPMVPNRTGPTEERENEMTN